MVVDSPSVLPSAEVVGLKLNGVVEVPDEPKLNTDRPSGGLKENPPCGPKENVDDNVEELPSES